MTDFRLCSTCQSRSQAGLCHCTQQLISDQPEPTIARLRYSLGGDRPSQTTRHAWSQSAIQRMWLDIKNDQGGISLFDSVPAGAGTSKSPAYATQIVLNTNAKV